MARYCKAYKLEDLRKFPEWSAAAREKQDLGNESIVYIQESHVVTVNPLDLDSADDFIFDSVSDAWKAFCANDLSFAVPTEEELSPAISA